MDPQRKAAMAQVLKSREPWTLDNETERVFGMKPGLDRGNVLPLPDGDGGIMAPQWMYEMGKAVSLPGHVMRGGDWSPEDVTNMALTVGGSAGAASMAGGVPKGALGANVWHGSPHKYGPDDVAKSLDHIGKGEGAQAYGWGRYDAGAREVAEQYQKRVPGQDAKRAFLNELPEDADFDEVVGLLGKGHFSENQEAVIRALYADDWLGFDYPSQAISAAYSKNIDNWDPSPALRQAVDDSGNIYKLDLPDEDIARYMDWDKPLSEQPSAAVSLAGQRLESALDSGQPIMDDVFQRFEDGSMTGGELYRLFGNDKSASEALGKAGIPGLKYLDGMSRDAGRGSHNYVTWDQNVLKRMKMLQRNDETFASGSPAGLLAPREEKPNQPDARKMLMHYLNGGA